MMTQLRHTTCYCICLLLAGCSLIAAATELPPLPAWQVLEFEERAFWATARSRVEITQGTADEQSWELKASSSVVGNSELVMMSFMPTNGQAIKRTRLSRGKEQRFKSFDFQANHIVRERRNPGADLTVPPAEWPLSNRKKIIYPEPATNTVITDAYMLLLLADRLQTGLDESTEVIIQTDLNFYRVRMTSGNGIPIDVNYEVKGGESVVATRETRAVALHITPVGTPAEKPDFSLLGLHAEIILFFDRLSGLPVQVRGIAPRIGQTQINLKAVTLREPQT